MGDGISSRVLLGLSGVLVGVDIAGGERNKITVRLGWGRGQFSLG